MIRKKLLVIQSTLKAPKGQTNNFGKYKYRSCEDILEAVKPLLLDNGCVLVLSDEVVEVGGRIYVKATATLTETEKGTQISNTAYAREAADKKGMDESQITGTASSYARKYALNGLFCIDDTKDADTNEYQSAGSMSTTKAKKNDGEAERAEKPLFIKATEPAKTKILSAGNYYELGAYAVNQLQTMLKNEPPEELREDIEAVIAAKGKQ